MAELGSVATAVRAAVAKTARRRQRLDRRVHGRRTAGTASTRRSAVSRPGSRTSTRSPRSARSASFAAPTRTRATRWPRASPRRSRRRAGPSPASLHQTRIYSEVVADAAEARRLLPRRRHALRDGRRARRAPAEDRRGRASAPPSARCRASRRSAWRRCSPARPASFSVVEQGGKLGARIDDAFLPDLAARKKFAAARVPKLVDIALDELLSLQPSKLAKKIEGAQVVIVRSQEIDHAGEAGFTFQARQVMDTVIDNLARAIRKLAAAGVEHAVVIGRPRPPVLPRRPRRVDADRRARAATRSSCIGAAGSVAAARRRPAASAWPRRRSATRPTSTSSSRRGCGVFKAGGDLAFHHGGPSLQELVIPVLTVRTEGARVGAADRRARSRRPVCPTP